MWWQTKQNFTNELDKTGKMRFLNEFSKTFFTVDTRMPMLNTKIYEKHYTRFSVHESIHSIGLSLSVGRRNRRRATLIVKMMSHWWHTWFHCFLIPARAVDMFWWASDGSPMDSTCTCSSWHKWEYLGSPLLRSLCSCENISPSYLLLEIFLRTCVLTEFS